MLINDINILYLANTINYIVLHRIKYQYQNRVHGKYVYSFRKLGKT